MGSVREDRLPHPADEIVRSAHQALIRADEYLIPADAPTGALVKADNVKLGLDAQRDGKVRLTCGSWEDARVLAPGEMLGLRREGTFWVVSRLDLKTLTKPQSEGRPLMSTETTVRLEIREVLHRGRAMFDAVETVAETELQKVHAELGGLIGKLPGAVNAPAPAPDLSGLLAQVASLTSQVASLTAAVASKDETIKTLQAQIAALNTPATPPPVNPAPTPAEVQASLADASVPTQASATMQAAPDAPAATTAANAVPAAQDQAQAPAGQPAAVPVSDPMAQPAAAPATPAA